MALTTIPAAGAKLRGSVLNSLITELRPVSARKTSDETVNNSAALQNDNELFVAVEANLTYWFDLTLLYQSNTTPDIKFGWTFPSSLTMRYAALGTATTFQGFYMDQTSVPALDGAGLNVAAVFEGVVIVSSTAGTLQLQWAQNTANASDTIVRAGSTLVLKRLS